jgi:hypothetical protein
MTIRSRGPIMTRKHDDLLTPGRIKSWLRAEGYEGRVSKEYVLKINARIARIVRADSELPGNRRMLRDTL